MKAVFWVKSLAATVYVVFGLWSVFLPAQISENLSGLFNAVIDEETVRILGLLILVYGLFRIYTHYKEYSRREE